MRFENLGRQVTPVRENEKPQDQSKNTLGVEGEQFKGSNGKDQDKTTSDQAADPAGMGYPVRHSQNC